MATQLLSYSTLMINKIFQLLPDHLRGKQRLARLVLKILRKAAKSQRVSGSYGCVYELPNLIENVSFELFINGAYERETLDFMVLNIPKDACVLDIGANIGSLAVPLAVRRGDITIHCVEASPHVAGYLRKNIEINGLKTRIHVHELALSDSQLDTVDFFSPVDLFGKGSMASNFSKQAIPVKNLSLDQFATTLGRSIDFIKIDIEGYEVNVFNSGKQTLSAPNAPLILFEACDWAEKVAGNNPGAAQIVLRNFGYQLANMLTPENSLIENIQVGFAMVFARKIK